MFSPFCMALEEIPGGSRQFHREKQITMAYGDQGIEKADVRRSGQGGYL